MSGYGEADNRIGHSRGAPVKTPATHATCAVDPLTSVSEVGGGCPGGVAVLAPGPVSNFGRFAPDAGGYHRGAAQVVGEQPFQASGAGVCPSSHGDARRAGIAILAVRRDAPND